MPLVMNLFGTMERIRAALGREPAELGSELLHAVQRLNPPSLGTLWQNPKRSVPASSHASRRLSLRRCARNSQKLPICPVADSQVLAP